MRLFDICDELRNLGELAESGEISADELKDTLDAVNLEWNEKVDSICYLIKENAALAAAIKQEEEALTIRRKQKEKTVESLKAYLVAAFQSLGKTKEETAKNKINLRDSKAVTITDEAKFMMWARENAPELYTVKITEAPNKTEIKKALEAGAEVESAVLTTNTSAIIK